MSFKIGIISLRSWNPPNYGLNLTKRNLDVLSRRILVTNVAILKKRIDSTCHSLKLTRVEIVFSSSVQCIMNIPRWHLTWSTIHRSIVKGSSFGGDPIPSPGEQWSIRRFDGQLYCLPNLRMCFLIFPVPLRRLQRVVLYDPPCLCTTPGVHDLERSLCRCIPHDGC